MIVLRVHCQAIRAIAVALLATSTLVMLAPSHVAFANGDDDKSTEARPARARAPAQPPAGGTRHIVVRSPVEGASGVKPLPDKTIDLRIVRQDVNGVLQTIAEQAGTRVNVGKGFNRSVSNLRLTGKLPAALDVLVEQTGGLWWWNGSEITVVDRRDVVTRTLKMPDHDQVLRDASSLGLPVSVLTVHRTPSPGIVRISGPAGVVQEVEALAKTVAEVSGRMNVTRYGAKRKVNINN